MLACQSPGKHQHYRNQLNLPILAKKASLIIPQQAKMAKDEEK